MPATANLGEGTYDARRAAEINMRLATGNLNNNQNKLPALIDVMRPRQTKPASVEGKKSGGEYSGKGMCIIEAPLYISFRLNVNQASALRRSSLRVTSRSVELERDNIQEDEHEGMHGEKEDEALQMVMKQWTVAPTPKPKRRKAGDPLAGWAIELVPGDKTTAVTPREYAQQEPEEFSAQDPVSYPAAVSRLTILVAVLQLNTEKELLVFLYSIVIPLLGFNPTKNTCLHWDPIDFTIPNPDPTKIEQAP
ncbi:hypothetical protein B0H13DRAFT_1920503 [Mycena leptocephala]|nr:hypothetical protein B0H13DRAFT_1920503 [Mycena leptocephala]